MAPPALPRRRLRQHAAAAAAALACLCLALRSLRPAAGGAAAFTVPRKTVVGGMQADRGPGQGEAGSPCRRRAKVGPCAEEDHPLTGRGVDGAPPAAAAIEVPEANYFTETAALDCLSEGCSVEEAEAIREKLERDEARIMSFIERLSAPGAAAGALSGDEAVAAAQQLKREDLDWYNQFLAMSRDLRTKLEPTVASIAFGGGETGGFLNLKKPPMAHSAR